MKCYLCIVVVAIVCLSYVQCFLSPSHTSFPISTVNIFSSTDQEAEISSLAPRFPRVEIEYCPGCRWLLRSAYLAQELLTTFESSLGSYLPRDSVLLRFHLKFYRRGGFNPTAGDLRNFYYSSQWYYCMGSYARRHQRLSRDEDIEAASARYH